MTENFGLTRCIDIYQIEFSKRRSKEYNSGFGVPNFYDRITIVGIQNDICLKFPYLRNGMYIDIDQSRLHHHYMNELDSLFSQIDYFNSTNMTVANDKIEEKIIGILDTLVLLHYSFFIKSLEE